VYVLDIMIDRYHVGYRLYSLTKRNVFVTNYATFVLTSALNFSEINKPIMSEREVNKIFSELATTVGALATTGLMMYNLSIGPHPCHDGVNPVIRYTDDYRWLLLALSVLLEVRLILL